MRQRIGHECPSSAGTSEGEAGAAPHVLRRSRRPRAQQSRRCRFSCGDRQRGPHPAPATPGQRPLGSAGGGGMEMTDSLPGAAVREVKEETGLEVEITGLVGTYTDPRHVIAYTDGEVRRQFNVCFTARIVGGRLALSDEPTELQFVHPDEIGDLPMRHTQQLRIRHFQEHRDPARHGSARPVRRRRVRTQRAGQGPPACLSMAPCLGGRRAGSGGSVLTVQEP